MSPHHHPIRLALLGLAALTHAACSDDDSADEPTSSKSASSETTSSDDAKPDDSKAADTKSADTLYLVATAFYTGDLVETYLTTTPTFDKQTEVELTGGVKVLGEAVPIVYENKVYVTDEADPASIKRYEAGSGDTLKKTGEVSFGGEGVTSIPAWFVFFVNAEKAYVFDQEGNRIVVWNPAKMELTGKQIDLSKVDRKGWVTRLALELFSPQRRGSQLLIPTTWVGQDKEYRHAVGVVILDTERDEVVSVTEDERCGEAYMSLKSPDGDIYFFPTAESSSQHFFADKHGPSCVLRMRADADELDPDFKLDLSALGNGQAAASGVPDGASGFYFGVADEAEFEMREDNDGAYWHVYHYDFKTKASNKVDGMPTWPGSLYTVPVDGKVYLPYWRQGDEGPRTDLYQVGTKLEESFGFDASWGGFGKLR